MHTMTDDEVKAAKSIHRKLYEKMLDIVLSRFDSGECFITDVSVHETDDWVGDQVRELYEKGEVMLIVRARRRHVDG